MAMKLTLEQRLLQRMSPQQIQLMRMVQLPTLAFEARIKEEIESNPALEEGGENETNDEPEESELNNEENDNDTSDENQDDDGAPPEAGEQNEETDFDISDYISDDDDTPAYKYEANNHSPDDEERSVPIGTAATFYDKLLEQLGFRNLNEHQRKVCEYLVGSLDDSGYLRRDLQSIVDDLAFTQGINTTQKEVESLLCNEVQQLDPAGIGARDLRESLLLQLQRRPSSVSQRTALTILTKLYDEFVRKHYEKITERLEIDEDDLRDAIDEIIRLNPKPGNSLSEGSAPVEQVIPDFSLSSEDTELRVLLNGRNSPELKVSRKYGEMLREFAALKGKANKEQRNAMLFVKQKIDNARWFIEAINQRQHTLLTAMQAIVDFQREFFNTGDETKLKPMILKDIAERVKMDISTISRVSNSKYIQTPYGTFPVKYFFSESLTNDEGEEVSTREVKKILQELIGNEDKKKPWTDENLMKELKQRGYNLARRTVAKYREQLDIPVARLRVEL